MAPRRSAFKETGRSDVLFEFCVEGVPLSAQTKNRARLKAWKDKVADQARLTLAAALMLETEIDIHLSEFSETKAKDRDNVAKPIQDAMQGVLFLNDRQVLRLESEWCDINGRYKVRHMSPAIAAALVAGRDFVWIRIRHHLPRETLNP